ncbi:MAG: hypothetical protein IJA01_02585 [Firmicutes bacterium]|nr:hypothetical protein [Bacillota bacterium]
MNKKYKITALLLTLVLMFGVSAQATIAYLTDRTDEIKNTFVPVKSPAHQLDIELVGEKVFEGKTWEDEVFSFKLLKEADDPAQEEQWIQVGTADVDKDNSSFDMSGQLKQQLTDEGTYRFGISEVQGSIKGVEYDKREYGFAVIVSKAQDGALHIESVYPEYEAEDDEFAVTSLDGVYTVKAEFVNIYEEEPSDPSQPSEPTDPSEPSQPTDPSEPTDPTKPGDGDSTEGTSSTDRDSDDASKTGDEMNIALWIALMIASGTMIVVVLIDRRRRRA